MADRYACGRQQGRSRDTRSRSLLTAASASAILVPRSSPATLTSRVDAYSAAGKITAVAAGRDDDGNDSPLEPAESSGLLMFPVSTGTADQPREKENPMTVADLSSGAGVRAPEGWVTGTWTIDPAHTSVGFAVRCRMSRVRGTFSEVSGQIVTSPDPSESTGSADIAVSSASTGNQMRDNHLLTADFFDAERCPR